MASTHQSNDTNISEIMKEIDIGKIQLPDFQRGWVWDDERIKALIASFTSSYPVGALMFLDYGGDSVRFKFRPFTGTTTSIKPETLVLDGQQRLTSMFCSMYSPFPVPTQTSKKEPINRYYYLDIDHCINSLKDKTIDRSEAVISIPEDKIIRRTLVERLTLI